MRKRRGTWTAFLGKENCLQVSEGLLLSQQKLGVFLFSTSEQIVRGREAALHLGEDMASGARMPGFRFLLILSKPLNLSQPQSPYHKAGGLRYLGRGVGQGTFNLTSRHLRGTVVYKTLF